ncbi:ArsR family transcriptional regulator [bacterium]|nr:ArsR family transcriptional regulator [bacterium]
MLEAIITSKTRLKLLTKFFLNSGTEAYLQELASEFGESSNGIRVELNHLTKAKLLIPRREGRTVLYQANTQHGLFATIQEALQKNVGLDRLVDLLVKRCGDIEAAWVVGEYARGIDCGLIDLVILGSVNMLEFQQTVDKTSRLIERKIRFLVLDLIELKAMKQHLDLEHALQIWGSKVGQITPS